MGAGFFSRSSLKRRAINWRVIGNAQAAAIPGNSAAVAGAATGMRPYQMSSGRLWSSASAAWHTSAVASGTRAGAGRRCSTEARASRTSAEGSSAARR